MDSLTPELIDLIIFSMENQNEGYYLDTELGELVPETGVPDTGDPRFQAIPEWNSAKGFQLMERFVDSMRNPLWRKKLHEALQGGKGVFRRFKNVLKEKSEIERQWFSFKERELRKTVYLWYNDLAEIRGWALMGPEPDETGDLVLSDFLIAKGEPPAELDELDQSAFCEAFDEHRQELADYLYSERKELREFRRDDSLFRAESPDGELAGFLWSREGENEAGAAFAEILQLYVVPEYRNLGLGWSLLERYCDHRFAEEGGVVYIALAKRSERLEGKLRQFGFVEAGAGFALTKSAWESPN
jgi:GNAT superfamily N-acetyltransferase